MSLLRLINGNNFLVCNRDLAILIGLNAAVMLSELIDKYDFYKRSGQLVSLCGEDGEWFYETYEDLELRTGISKHEQETAFGKIKNLGFACKVVKGIPGKRYFKLNVEAIENYINSNIISRTPERGTLFAEKGNVVHRKGERNKNKPKQETKKILKHSPTPFGAPENPEPLKEKSLHKGGPAPKPPSAFSKSSSDAGSASEEESIQAKIVKSSIPMEDWLAVIMMYTTRKGFYDKKRNPMGYVFNDWKLGKHKVFETQTPL